MSEDPEGDDPSAGEGGPAPTDDNSSDDEDPFEQFEAAVGDREGDPFETLPDDATSGGEDRGEKDSGENQPEPSESGTAPADENWPAGSEAGDSTPSEPGSSEGDLGDGPTTTDPSTGLSDPISGPGAPGQDAGGTDASLTGEDPTGSTAGEAPATGIAGGGNRTSSGSEGGEGFAGAAEREGDPFEGLDDAFEEMDVGAVDPETVWQDLASAESRGSVGDPGQRTYAEVSKHSYCEQCEFFSGPPEITCQHEGTEIVEFLDMETVRVVDCPIVAERAELATDKSVALQDEEES